jgi:hypothetical protein
MTTMIFRVLSRASRVINNPFAMNRGYVVPRRGDSANDFKRVVLDMKKVGRDLKKVSSKELAKHGR